MSPALIVSLASVGIIGGFFSGLLGFGGGVVMVGLIAIRIWLSILAFEP